MEFSKSWRAGAVVQPGTSKGRLGLRGSVISPLGCKAKGNPPTTPPTFAQGHLRTCEQGHSRAAAPGPGPARAAGGPGVGNRQPPSPRRPIGPATATGGRPVVPGCCGEDAGGGARTGLGCRCPCCSRAGRGVLARTDVREEPCATPRLPPRVPGAPGRSRALPATFRVGDPGGTAVLAPAPRKQRARRPDGKSTRTTVPIPCTTSLKPTKPPFSTQPGLRGSLSLPRLPLLCHRRDFRPWPWREAGGTAPGQDVALPRPLVTQGPHAARSQALCSARGLSAFCRHPHGYEERPAMRPHRNVSML